MRKILFYFNDVLPKIQEEIHNRDNTENISNN